MNLGTLWLGIKGRSLNNEGFRSLRHRLHIQFAQHDTTSALGADMLAAEHVGSSHSQLR